MVASSTSMIGMSSFIAYTRRHCLHFKLSGFSRYSRGCLHAGQTRISSKSLAIMTRDCTPCQNRSSQRPSHGEKELGKLHPSDCSEISQRFLLCLLCDSVTLCLRGELFPRPPRQCKIS